MKVIDNAIKFYEECPTGQYDEEAVLALKHCKVILEGGMYTTEFANRMEELRRVMLKDESR